VSAVPRDAFVPLAGSVFVVISSLSVLLELFRRRGLVVDFTEAVDNDISRLLAEPSLGFRLIRPRVLPPRLRDLLRLLLPFLRLRLLDRLRLLFPAEDELA